MPIQTITYDPQSIRGRRERLGNGQAAWILCRRLEQFPIENDQTLWRLAEHGRVKPDDFLFNSNCGACLQARDIPELRVIFRNAAIHRIEKISTLLARLVAVFWRDHSLACL